MRRVLLVPLLAALLMAGCTGEPTYDTVDELFAAAGGESWCDDELRVTLEPFVGNCGDAATDSRVVLGVGLGGEELRESVDGARDNLLGDDQLLLVPSDPDGEFGWQLRSRDRALLEQARERIGGVILANEDELEAWLAQ